MERWQKHEKHDTEAKTLLEELGFVDSRGRIRRWDGEKFWSKFEPLGHSSLAFEKCSCSRVGEF